MNSKKPSPPTPFSKGSKPYLIFYYLLIVYVLMGLAYFSGHYLLVMILISLVLLHPFLQFTIHKSRIWNRIITWFLIVYSGYFTVNLVRKGGHLKEVGDALIVGLQFSYAIAVVFLLYLAALQKNREKILITLFAVTIILGLNIKHIDYAVFVILFSIILFLLLITENQSRFSPCHLKKLFWRVDIWGYLILTVFLSVGMIRAIPLTQKWLQKRLVQYFIRSRTNVGFSEYARIGSIGRIQLRTDSVMRLFSPRPLYLAGKVYDKYVNGVWLSQNKDEKKVKGGKGSAEYRYRYKLTRKKLPAFKKLGVISPLDKQARIYFLPKGTTWFGSDEAEITLDAYGMVFGEEISDYSFGNFIANQQLPENSTKIVIDAKTQKKVQLLASKIVQDAQLTREKANKIVNNFHDSFEYSLEGGLKVWEDPIENFLFNTKSGHCEYFATAMVFLLEALEIKAHYVTGFLATDHNPFGDYYIVRSQDAHAWVEVFVPGEGWQAYDPTPPGWSSCFSRPSSLDFLLDYSRVLFNRGISRLSQWVAILVVKAEKLFGSRLVLAGFVCVILFLIYRVFRLLDFSSMRSFFYSRFQRLQKPSTRDGELLDILKAVLADLEKRGLSKNECETIEEFKKRIKKSNLEQPVFKAVEYILGEFSSFRYGNKTFNEIHLARLKKELENQKSPEKGFLKI